MRIRVPSENRSEIMKNWGEKLVKLAILTLFSEALAVHKDGAASVAEDLAADPAVMSPPKRRELDGAGVTARRDMV